jgi:L-threonylcarbamoyladenylate synthase
MEIIKVDSEDIREALEAAVKVICEGGIVAYPTETFYGLAVRFDDDEALKKLTELKGRPTGKSLPLIVGTEASLPMVADGVSDTARRLIEVYWPGPLTIVLKAREGLPEQITLKGKVAVRVPGESLGLQLARTLTFPVTATSANPSGMPPPVDAETVVKYFPEGVDLVLDAGLTKGGASSTVVDASEEQIRIIRPGAMDISEFLDQ